MNATEALTDESSKPVDSFRTTGQLAEDVDRAIATRDRLAMQDARNRLRHRAATLEGRLNDGDAWFREHAPGMRPTAEAWTKAERHWMTLLQEYERAFDAMERADAALTGGIPA